MRRESGDDTYVNHILAEHRRLDQLILRTLHAIATCEEGCEPNWQEPVLGGLSAIRQELAQHFAEEEAGGCLEEAVARCPCLSSEAGRVQAEHASLLNAVEDLIQRCRQIQRPTRPDLASLDQELRAVVHELRRHEAEENQIIERGFSVCLENTDDSRECV